MKVKLQDEDGEWTEAEADQVLVCTQSGPALVVAQTSGGLSFCHRGEEAFDEFLAGIGSEPVGETVTVDFSDE